MMRGHWYGLEIWWIAVGILLLIGLVALAFIIFVRPKKHIENSKRSTLLQTLDYESLKNNVNQEESELRKQIILSEEDEHFDDPAIYSFLVRYARYEIDSRQYFESIKPFVSPN